MTPAQKRAKNMALVALAVLAGCVLVLILRPPCLIRTVFGVRCPACGTTRMVYRLLAGDVPGAVRENAMMLILLPVLLVYGVLEAVFYLRGKRPLAARPWMWIIYFLVFCAAIVFGVWRNFP